MGYRYNAITGELDVVDTMAATAGYIKQIDTDAGSAVPVADIINLFGTAAQGISSAGAGNTVTLTISDATEAQKGVSELATDAESVAGTDTSRTIVPSSLKAKLGAQTLYGIPYGETDSVAISWSTAMSDGQLLIGATGAAPAPANLTSAGGTVTITNGANTINLEAGATLPTSFVTDAGTATPALNILNVLGGNNISTVGAVNNLTINLTGTTDHAIQIGNATGSLTSIGAGLTGELLVATTGADPAWGTTSYGDFSFTNFSTPATPIMLAVINLVADVGSTADLRLSVPPLGDDPMISWEVQGTLFYAAGVDNSVAGDPWKLSTSSDPSGGIAAITVTNATGAVTFASAYEFPVADGTVNYVLKTDGGGNIDWASTSSLIIDQQNILYVGKHGNDLNDGLNIESAFLTFGAALTAAAATDAIVCLDHGIYTENLTDPTGVRIFAPNATISGAHILINDSDWQFGTALVATATIGFTLNTAASEAKLVLSKLIAADTGIGIVSLQGKLFAYVEHTEIVNGFAVGSTTVDEVYFTFEEIEISGTGVAFGIAAAGDINIIGNCVEDAGAGTLFFTVGAASNIAAKIAKVDIENLSNITAAAIVRLDATRLSGTLTEAGAGTIDGICGATRIDGVPIGANIPSTSVFTTCDATTFTTNVAAAELSISGTTVTAAGTDANIPITLTPKGTEAVTIDGLDYPMADGNANDVVTTNGAGVLSLSPITGGGIKWTEVVGAAQAAAVNNGYVTNRGAGVTVTLPDTAAFGSVVRIVGKVGLWVVAQNAGETIHYIGQDSTPGAGGSLTATDPSDSVELLCTTANTDWTVMSNEGNITVT